jgi:hypothetical protein
MAFDIRIDRRRVRMAAALGRVEVGWLINLVIDDNEAGARMAVHIRDDEHGGAVATAGVDVEV